MAEETTIKEQSPTVEAVREEIVAERIPPHTCLPIWIDRLFDAVRDLNTPQITKEFVGANVVGSGHQSKVLVALRFLGLIDEDGNVTSRLRALRVVGPEFTTNLAIVVQQAYSGLLGIVVVKSASFNSLVNFLMQRYSMNRVQAISAGRFFLHLASRAGMELSEELSRVVTSKAGQPVRLESKEKSTLRKAPISSDNSRHQESALATVSSRFGEIRVVDRPSLELARKLLEIIENKLSQDHNER